MYAPSLFPSRERAGSTSNAGTPHHQQYGRTSHNNVGTHPHGSPQVFLGAASPGGAAAGWGQAQEASGLRQRRSTPPPNSNGSRGSGAAASSTQRVEWQDGYARTPRFGTLAAAPPTASLWDELGPGPPTLRSRLGQESTPGTGRGSATAASPLDAGFGVLSPSPGGPLGSGYGYDALGQPYDPDRQLGLFPPEPSPYAPSYGLLDTNGGPQSAQRRERYERWVLVFGFAEARGEKNRAGRGRHAASAERAHYEPPLRVLDECRQFGDVVDHEPGRGNWCFLRYATVWQAAKAVHRGAVLVDDAIVGVLAVTPDVALKFGLNVDELGATLGPFQDRSRGGPRSDGAPLSDKDPYRAAWDNNDPTAFAVRWWSDRGGTADRADMTSGAGLGPSGLSGSGLSGSGLSGSARPRSTNWCARLVQYLFATDLRDR